MRRRDLLKGAAAGAAAIAAPRIGRAEKQNKLVFVPTSDLAVLDPVVTFNRPTRNYAYLVFDTLYGLDTSWVAQPQMVEGHQIEQDGLIWNLKLRDGLRFHDNQPVLARDVVASIRRFAQRISLTGALMSATDELSAPDDHTVRFQLKRPFPHLPDALAGPGGPVPAIMPSVSRRPRPSNRLPKSSAVVPIVSCRKSMSAGRAAHLPGLRGISRARMAPSASPQDRKSRISIVSNG